MTIKSVWVFSEITVITMPHGINSHRNSYQNYAMRNFNVC